VICGERRQYVSEQANITHRERRHELQDLLQVLRVIFWKNVDLSKGIKNTRNGCRKKRYEQQADMQQICPPRRLYASEVSKFPVNEIKVRHLSPKRKIVNHE
jgi:hypothetical protein